MVVKAILWLSLPFSPSAMADQSGSGEIDQNDADMGPQEHTTGSSVKQNWIRGAKVAGSEDAASAKRAAQCFAGAADGWPQNHADRSHRLITFANSVGW
jgi:hypothetical protein